MILNTLMGNYYSILEISLTFIGTILAIFFTLVALPIQNILGRYSQELVENVRNDGKLRFYFLYFIGTFGYNFFILILPKNIIFVLVSFFLGLTSLLILYRLVNRVFYLLDIRNQIKDISMNIQDEMSYKFKNSYENDKEFKLLENEIEIIIDVTQKAIQENRYEIADSGFREIGLIVKKYIKLNKLVLNPIKRDKFIDYILNSLINSKGLISTNSHPKVMAALVKCSGDIAKETLTIDMNYIDYTNDRTNFLTLRFVNLLNDIILSFEIVKETSNIPEIAGDQLVEIGKTAIDLEYPRVAESIVRKFGEISRISINLHSFRGDLISQYTNLKISYLFNYSIKNMDKMGMNRKFILESIIIEINRNIEFFLNDEHSHPFDPTNTFTGSVADYNISVLAHTLIETIKNKTFEKNSFEKNINYDGLNILEELLDLLKNNIKFGMKVKNYHCVLELMENTYTIAIGLTRLIKDLDNLESKKAVNILENKVLIPLYDSILEVLINDSRLFETLPIYFSLIGIILVEDENKFFEKVIEKHILSILSLPTLIKNNKGNRKTILYQYIRLLGLWIYKWDEKSNLIDQIIGIIKIQNKELTKETFSNALPEENRFYPNILIENRIYRPISPYNYNDFILTNEELFNPEIVSEFEKFIKTKIRI